MFVWIKNLFGVELTPEQELKQAMGALNKALARMKKPSRQVERAATQKLTKILRR